MSPLLIFVKRCQVFLYTSSVHVLFLNQHEVTRAHLGRDKVGALPPDLWGEGALPPQDFGQIMVFVQHIIDSNNLYVETRKFLNSVFLSILNIQKNSLSIICINVSIRKENVNYWYKISVKG